MGLWAIAKVVFVPAIVAGTIYALLVYVVFPLYHRHYANYSQYLPLSAIGSHTSSFRQRVGSLFSRTMLPPSMRWRTEIVDGRRGSGSGDEPYFGEEEGESMVGFDIGRRERMFSHGNVSAQIDSERRLSRDLEAGFRDDESESDDHGGAPTR